MMKRLICIVAMIIAALAADGAAAQGTFPGLLQPNQVVGNPTTVPALPSAISSTAATQYPYNGAGISQGHTVPWLDQNWLLSGDGVYPFQITDSNNLSIGYPSSTIACSGGTGVSQCGGLTFSASFSWTGQSSFSVSYTALSTDSPATVATAWCNNVIANATLISGSFVCDASFGAGTFNIAWNVLITSVSISSTGTGSITFNFVSNAANRDSIVVRLMHGTPNYTSQANDQDTCVMLGTTANPPGLQICSWTTQTSPSYQTMGEFSTFTGGAVVNQLDIGQGLRILPPTGGPPAFEGTGTINTATCAACGYYAGNVQSLYYAGGYTALNGTNGLQFLTNGTLEALLTATVFTPQNDNALSLGQAADRWSNVWALGLTGGSSAGSSVTVKSTSNGTPSGDSATVQASTINLRNVSGTASTVNCGSTGQTNCVFVMAGSASGATTLAPSSAASGTLTLPATTDQLIARATTDTLTNKTFDTASNSWKLNGTQIATAADMQTQVAASLLYFKSPGVNFNATGDTAITLALPTGFTRFFINTVLISNASHTLASASVELCTAASAGGVCIAGAQTPTVTATTDATNNNAQTLTLTNAPTTSFLLSGLTSNQVFFHVATPEGAAATADVSVVIRPIP